MKSRKVAIALAAVGATLLVTGCSTTAASEATFDAEVQEYLDENIPTRDRASVRVCEDLAYGQRLTNDMERITWITEAMQEVVESDDPDRMSTPLLTALLTLGDSIVGVNQVDPSSAAFELAETCASVVSGEYGL